MAFVKITHGIQVRDQKKNAKGHLHSIIARAPDGSFIEQSKDHQQIVQRRLYPDGRVVLSCFTEREGVMVQIGEQEHFLHAPRV